MELVSLTVFLSGLQWPLSAVSFSDCSASYQNVRLKLYLSKKCEGDECHVGGKYIVSASHPGR